MSDLICDVITYCVRSTIMRARYG